MTKFEIAVEVMKVLAQNQPDFTAEEAADISVEWAEALVKKLSGL